MTKLCRTSALLLASLLTVFMVIGCGANDDIGAEATVPANFVSASPPSGSEIAANGRITLTFDNAPTDVTVSTGVAESSGRTVTVKGPFTPGPLNLTVTWADGTQTLTYTVSGPD